MEQSDGIQCLAEALAKAQGQIKGALKDSFNANPFVKAKYADLTSVWDACREPLTANGLSVVQAPAFDPNLPDHLVVETQLNHSSGEWMRGRFSMKIYEKVSRDGPPKPPDAQSIGSQFTYMRRYSLAAMVGVAPEDDDGEAAVGHSEKKPETKSQPAQAQPAATAPTIADRAKFLKAWGDLWNEAKILGIENMPAIDMQGKSIDEIKEAGKALKVQVEAARKVAGNGVSK